MVPKDEMPVVAAVGVEAAIAAPTVIDADELDEARPDRRWRDFCLNAEQYVAETTRPRPRVEQTA